MESSGLRVGVLGPVRAWRDGVPLHLGGPRQRAFLAMLVFRPGWVHPADELTAGIWGDLAPARVGQSLRTYASRLRRVLSRAGEPNPLVCGGGGYALRLPERSTVDLAEFEALTRAARETADPRAASVLLRRALELVKGHAMSGVDGPFAERRRAEWEERRLSTVEDLLRLDLACGRHHSAAAELTAFCRAHPFRERATGYLMTALYRAGRQADALRVYTGVRRRLAEEFGVDPGPGLQETYLRIVRADPGLLSAPG